MDDSLQKILYIIGGCQEFLVLKMQSKTECPSEVRERGERPLRFTQIL